MSIITIHDTSSNASSLCANKQMMLINKSIIKISIIQNYKSLFNNTLEVLMNRLFLFSILTFCFLTGIINAQENYLRSLKFPSLPGVLHNSHDKFNTLITTAIFLPAQALIDTNTKVTYTYDSKGNELTEVHQAYSGGSWGNVYRNTMTYDNNSNILTALSENWTGGSWVNSFLNTYTYDGSGNPVSAVAQMWMNSAWVNSSRNSFTYDNSHRMLTSMAEYWTSGAWLNSNRDTYTYDVNGNLVSTLSDNWINNAWTTSNKETDTYDNNHNQLTTLNQSWFNNAWVNINRTTSTFDGNHNRLTYIAETYSNSAWVASSRITVTYDANNNLLTQLEETWFNSAWVNRTRNTKTYGSNNNMLTLLAEFWTNNAWVNSSKQLFTYDGNGNPSKLEYFTWVSNNWVYSKGGLDIALNGGKLYLSYYGAIVIFQFGATGINDKIISDNTFNLQQNYPNPFNPSTTINFSITKEENVKLNVYNLLGDKVASIVNENKQAGNYSVLFNASTLSSGIYFYKLEAGQNSRIRKMLLIK